MITNTPATLYNKVRGSETYQRWGLIAVHWENRKAANVLRSGLLEADSVMVMVPYAIGSKYLLPFAWQALPDKTDRWTLQVGDYLVKGLVTDEIEAGFTISDLKAKYDDCVRITSVDTFDIGSPRMYHWEVGAK